MRSAVLLALIAMPASADPTELHATTSEEPPPALDLPLPRFESFGAATHEWSRRFAIGKLRATVGGGDWAADDRSFDLPADGSLSARGWRTGVTLQRAVGPFTLVASANLDRYDDRWGRATYVDTGVAIGKFFRLSRWMHAWIALSFGYRAWLDTPAAHDSTTMLTIGTTFR